MHAPIWKARPNACRIRQKGRAYTPHSFKCKKIIVFQHRQQIKTVFYVLKTEVTNFYSLIYFYRKFNSCGNEERLTKQKEGRKLQLKVPLPVGYCTMIWSFRFNNFSNSTFLCKITPPLVSNSQAVSLCLQTFLSLCALTFLVVFYIVSITFLVVFYIVSIGHTSK